MAKTYTIENPSKPEILIHLLTEQQRRLGDRYSIVVISKDYKTAYDLAERIEKALEADNES